MRLLDEDNPKERGFLTKIMHKTNYVSTRSAKLYKLLCALKKGSISREKSTEGAALIKSLGKIIQKTGEKRSTFFRFQSISLAVQQGNTASVLGTARPGKNLDEIYYL